jgi:pimeloyl-ACP methyl ester carboxylesterase
MYRIKGYHGRVDTRPPVALVHGFASSTEHNWGATGWLDLLADAGREVIAVDLLGHGRAPRPTEPDAYQLVESAVADALRGRGRLDAIGFSAGAMVLLRLAAASPGQFRRLALLGIGPGALDPAEPAAVIAALEGDPDPRDTQAVVFRRLADRLGNDRAALVAFLSRRPTPLRATDLARISCPVLVVLGDKDPAGPGDDLVAALGDARLVTLTGVDHFGTPSDVRCMQAVLGFVEE